jgi:hypothetical protein
MKDVWNSYPVSMATLAHEMDLRIYTMGDESMIIVLDRFHHVRERDGSVNHR